jgi:hypothetical protein
VSLLCSFNFLYIAKLLIFRRAAADLFDRTAFLWILFPAAEQRHIKFVGFNMVKVSKIEK